MEEQKKFPEPVEALVVILLAYGISILVTVIFSLIFSIINVSADLLNKIFIGIGSLLFLVLPVIYFRFKNYNINYLFRLKSISSEVILHSLIVGITIGVVGDELDRLIQVFITYPEFMKDLMNSMIAHTFFDWILLILGAVFIAAIGEEFLFRGFLQITLEKKGDVTRAVLLTSISWTLIHANPFWAVQIFIMGVIIGFLAWRTDSVFPGMIVHALNNFISLMFLNFQLDTTWEWYLTNDYVNPLVLIPSIALLVWSIMRITDIYKKEEY